MITAVALDVIENQVGTANRGFSDLWLAKSSRVIFMSYFIELPDPDDGRFKKYRKSVDPGGLFYTQYLQDLLGS